MNVAEHPDCMAGADDIPNVGRYQESISGLDLECGRVARPVEHPVASQ